jgi:hypothetical protein
MLSGIESKNLFSVSRTFSMSLIEQFKRLGSEPSFDVTSQDYTFDFSQTFQATHIDPARTKALSREQIKLFDFFQQDPHDPIAGCIRLVFL